MDTVIVIVANELAANLVTRGYQSAPLVCEEGLPEGAKLRDAFVDAVDGNLVLVYSHPLFERAEGTEPPVQNVVYRRRD